MPALPGVLDGRVERVDPVGHRRVAAQREVEHADVELVLVVDDELDAVDDVQDGRVADLVGRLDGDDVGVRRDADVVAVERVHRRAVEAVAGDDARHVRAVAEAVAGLVGARRRDDVGDDARAPVRALEVDQVAGDAGVDHGDADAGARVAEAPRLVGADRLRVARVEPARVHALALDLAVERDGDDVRLGVQRDGVLGGQRHGEAVDQLDPLRHVAVMARGRARGRASRTRPA